MGGCFDGSYWMPASLAATILLDAGCLRFARNDKIIGCWMLVS